MAELFPSVEDLVAVLERPKRLITPCTWVEPKKSGQRGLKIKASLQAETATIQGVTLAIGCHAEGFDLPSRIVVMAEIDRKSRAMARIDINGSRHVNRHAICEEWLNRDAGRTHFHDTRLHLGMTIEELFFSDCDLPVARPIDDMPQDFTEAMAKCGKLLHIDNLIEIEEPQWQPKRFPL